MAMILFLIGICVALYFFYKWYTVDDVLMREERRRIELEAELEANVLRRENDFIEHTMKEKKQ